MNILLLNWANGHVYGTQRTCHWSVDFGQESNNILSLNTHAILISRMQNTVGLVLYMQKEKYGILPASLELITNILPEDSKECNQIYWLIVFLLISNSFK